MNQVSQLRALERMGYTAHAYAFLFEQTLAADADLIADDEIDALLNVVFRHLAELERVAGARQAQWMAEGAAIGGGS